jgi:hypothetical protein
MSILKKSLRTIALVFGLLVIAVVLFALWFVNYRLEPLVQMRLQDAVLTGSDSLYRLEVEDLNINLFNGNIRIKNLALSTDSQRYHSLHQHGKLPTFTFQFGMKNTRLTGFNFYKLIRKRIISIRTLTCEESGLVMHRHAQAESPDSLNLSVWEMLAPDWKGVYVHNIKLQMAVSYFHADTSSAFEWRLDSCQLALKHFTIDSLSSADTNRVLYSDVASLRLSAMNLTTPDSLYRLTIDELVFSAPQNSLRVRDLRLHPTLDTTTFYRRIGHEADMYHVHLQMADMVNFSLNRWLRHGYLACDSLLLNRLVVDVYNDRNQPASGLSKLGRFPNQMVQRAPFLMHLPVVMGNNCRVTYTERNATSDMNGFLAFEKANGAIRNVTNDKHLLRSDSIMRVNATAIFLQHATVQASFEFNLTDTLGAFALSAEIRAVNAEQLNPLLFPLSQTRLKSFYLSLANFNMRGNERFATGNLQMRYHDLFLEVINDQRRNPDSPVSNWLLNKLVLYPANPMENKPPRFAPYVHYTRNEYKSFFNLVWKTLFEGVKEITMRDYVRESLD